jgi:hypothetical protein
VELGRIVQRTPMTPAECRELLGTSTAVPAGTVGD